MISSLQRKLTFFRDCLEAETQAQSFWNIRNNKSELVKELPIELTEFDLSYIPINDAYARSIETVLARYGREKQLMIGRFFIVAHHQTSEFGGRVRIRKICCPVIYIPCELEIDEIRGVARIVPILTRSNINPAAKQFFEFNDINAEEPFEQLLSAIQVPGQDIVKGQLTGQEIISHVFDELKNKLIESNSTLNVTLKRGANTGDCFSELQKSEVNIIDQTVSYVQRKQVSAQGCLHEIEVITERDEASTSLTALLNSNSNVLENDSTTFSLWRWLWGRRNKDLNFPLPVVLSDAQSTIIENANKRILSVAVGPPGTGKSFTIACLALKEFILGRSVLIVSQNQHAVDVVRRKLIDELGVDPSLTALGSDEGLSREVKEQLESLLSSPPDYDVKQYDILLSRLKNKLADRELMNERFIRSCRTHTNSDTTTPGIFSWLKMQSMNVTQSEKTFLSEQFTQLEELDEEISLLTANIINQFYNSKVSELIRFPDSRKSLRTFAKSLTARNSYYQKEYYKTVDYDHILDAIPFWFAPLSSIYRLLPLKKELFDVVIIDEASQCNMSVCLPALYRAKKAVIVGDPKQLNHVSFVSYQAQQTFFERQNIPVNELSSNFRNNSVLDYALSAIASPNDVVQLDEHFRSHPQIIEFSNKLFYQGKLKLMTSRPERLKSVIKLNVVDGKRVDGINHLEADLLVKHVQKIINEQAHLPESKVHSLGVLSFFSEQAKIIEKMLFNDLSVASLRRHNLRVGTPFSFQGEERDHMLISCCIDSQTSSSSYTYLERDDVFNVAITRARDVQTLFLSCEPEQIKPNSKLRSYVNYCLDYSASFAINSELDRDAFQDEIAVWLEGKGVTVYKNFIVAGISIDIMAVYEGRALAIDLIGFDGQLKGVLSLKQFKLLARAGLRSFLLPYQEWQEKREYVLKNLLLELGALLKSDDSGSTIDAFSDGDEQFFNQLADGISINKLHTRFIRSSDTYAAKQIHLLLEKRGRFTGLLRQCFQQGELTYKRYQNAFDDLLRACIIKLKQASIASELALSLLEQQKVLFEGVEYGDEYQDIFDARASMVEEQKNKVKELLNINEMALIQMDKTCMKLSRLYESASDEELNPHDILDELTDKIDLYTGLIHRKSD